MIAAIAQIGRARLVPPLHTALIERIIILITSNNNIILATTINTLLVHDCKSLCKIKHLYIVQTNNNFSQTDFV